MSVRDSFTRTLPRLRRPLALMLVSILGILLVGITYPQVASAANLGSAPDGSGNYAQCNLNWAQISGGSTTWTVYVYCNYGDGSAVGGANVTGVEYVYNNGGSSFTQTMGTTVVCPPTKASNGQCVDTTAKTVKNVQTLGFGSTTLNVTSVKVNYGSGYQNAHFNASGGGDTMPPQPADWYTGGSGPAVSDAVKGTGWTCSRTLDNTSTMVGAFTNGAATLGVAHATLTQGVWAWGDGSSNTTISTAGPTYPSNHTFPAIGSQPANGWTVSLTVTYVADTGHVFGDGSSTQTSVCSLRVDFLHPEDSSPGGTGSGSTGDSSLDSCIPSGWGILNPVNLIGGVGCLLKVLFIPSSATQTTMANMWTSITTKAPFSVLYEVVTFIPDNLSDFVSGVNDYSPLRQVGGTQGPIGTSPICHGTDNIHLCNGASGGSPFVGSGGPFDVNYSGTAHVNNPDLQMIRDIMLFVLGVLFFYACYRGVGEILK